MIRVVWKTPCRMTIHGHAAYGPKGQDIVCAAVSILWETLEDAIQDAGADIHSENAEAGAWFAFVWRGLSQLAAQYPKHVSVRREW